MACRYILIAKRPSARRSSLVSAAVCDTFPAWPPTRDSQGVEIWGIWWPTVLLNDLRTVCMQPLLRYMCRVCWSAILLENEPGWHQLLAVLDNLRKQSRNVIQSVNFRLVDEMEPTFTPEADPSRHKLFANFSLSTSRRLGLMLAFFPFDQTRLFWLETGGLR